MRRLRFLVIAVATAIVVSGAAVPASAVVFTDNTFNLADYNISPVFQSAGSSLSYGQCATCGNPGFGLQVQTFLPAPAATTAVGFANTLFSYDPSTQGPIGSINASVDKNLAFDVPGSWGNTFRPLIEQNGIFYLAAVPGPPLIGPGSTGYITISTSGLVASDFQQYDFTTGSFVAGSPDFAGSPLLFGLAQLFGVTTTADINGEADYDNLQIEIVAVPEPSSLALLSLAVVGGAALRRRRARGALPK